MPSLITLADVRARIEQRVAELNPDENGPDTRLLDPNGLADMLAERAVHKELTEILAMLDLVRQEEAYIQSEKTEAINSRTLVCGFLRLPLYTRRSIMSCLGFPGAKDTVTPEQELYQRFFGWVRENKLIDQLYAEITRAKP